MDIYTLTVKNAVEAVKSRDPEIITTTIEAFSALKPEDTIAELCNWVEDAVDGKNAEITVANSTIPAPDNFMVLVNAVSTNNLQAMFDYCEGEYPVLVVSMVLLIASLTS